MAYICLQNDINMVIKCCGIRSTLQKLYFECVVCPCPGAAGTLRGARAARGDRAGPTAAPARGMAATAGVAGLRAGKSTALE